MQMNKLPFSLYDFFGYLAAGFVWILAIDFTFDLNLFRGQYLDWKSGTLFVVITYIIGHINAHLSAFLIEKKFIGILGYPSINLFEEPKQPYKIFREFRKPLPSPFKEKIISKYLEDTGSNKLGESMFLYCFHTVKEKCPKTYDRLQSFMGLYGFSRNMCFALFVIGIIMLINGLSVKEYVRIVLGLISSFVSIVMLLRTLKFFRHYSLEVFCSYGSIKKS